MVTTPRPGANRTSRVEGIKERSNGLREPVASELLQETTHFTEDAIQILKFHGSYQQDNRDNRVKGQEKDYQFMLRTRNPGGYLPAALYLAIDKLSDELGNGTLRVTTRQGIQIHGILKKNLKAAIATIVNNMGSTLGACGDLNRNVMAPPVPFTDKPEYVYAREYADNIADLLTPQSGAYYDVWLDGEKAITAEEHPDVVAARQRDTNGSIFAGHSEPIYGTHYMPRKFKCSVTVPGDNSIDLYSQDVTLVVITSEDGELEGFNVLVGGGLGRTHNKEETFARLADPIGYVDKADVYDLLKAIVATQRDYGDRYNRRHARMKYLIHDWGVDRFREQLKTYFDGELHPYKPMPKFKYYDYLGWGEQGDGKLYLGISIENGRIQDTDTLQLKTALRELARQYEIPMRLTANHNIVLYDIDPAWKDDIDSLVKRHGIKRETEIDPLVRYSMACPALPTCGLAVTESERILPSMIGRIRTLIDSLGLGDQHLVIRMTGCPNGCARPYLGELGFVGQAPGAYQLWLGADADQNRLSEPFMNRMHETDLEKTLEPIFAMFKRQREAGEGFGDFCHRVGFDALREFAAIYKMGSGMSKASRTRHRIGVSDDLYTQLKALSTEQGKPMTELASEAIAAYLNQQS